MAADTKRGAGMPDVFCPECGPLRIEDDSDGCAVSPVDEYGECRFCGATVANWDHLTATLAAQGLHVVTAADKAVLDAMARAWFFEPTCRPGERRFATPEQENEVCHAELARREAEK